MIGSLLLGVAFQLATGAPTTSLVMRDATHSVRVPLVASADGPMLRPESLAPMLQISVRHDSASSYTLEVLGVRIQVDVGAAVARIGADVRQLASAPTLVAGHLMVPLQLVSDVFPGVVPNARWDADAKQLVVFNAAATRSTGLQAGEPAKVPARGASSRVANLPPVQAKHNRRTVIVDAGHGGVDNGMIGPLGGGPRIYEKNVTLAIAMKLGEQLKARGVDVVYTRTTDTLIALDDRGRIANRNSGDLFISIHVNAANPNWKDPGGSRGFETYFLSEAKTEDARRVEHMENESAQYEDGSKTGNDDPLSFIFNDMAQNQHLRESSDLAEIIQKQLRVVHPGPSRGVKQAGFRVLVTAYMPAVLVEVGFGTNPREAAYLTDSEKQDALAGAIANAAMEYLQGYERRVAGIGTGASAP
ncbi:MAG: N-acetylmuramoyl-L-alanine amidase [Gemmatimonadaceae bacterium]